MPEITQPLPTQQMTPPSATGASQSIDKQPVSHESMASIDIPTRLHLPFLINKHDQDPRAFFFTSELTAFLLQQPQEPMRLRGGGEKEEVCCGLYVYIL